MRFTRFGAPFEAGVPRTGKDDCVFIIHMPGAVTEPQAVPTVEFVKNKQVEELPKHVLFGVKQYCVGFHGRG